MGVRNVLSCEMKQNMFNKQRITNNYMYHINNIYLFMYFQLNDYKLIYIVKIINFILLPFIVVFRRLTYSQLHERFGAFKYLGNVSIK